MDIKNYQNNIAKYPYGITLKSGVNKDATIEDFYNNCIKETLLDKKKVIAWHNMLMEYANLPNAIYWIRYFEGASDAYKKKYGKYDTRRSCLTKYKDGFQYVFVSNYDVHELFNMIYNNVDVPTPQEFLNLMQSFTYKLSYCIGPSCDESEICSYPNLANVNRGYRTAIGKKFWYLAHIDGIKKPYMLQSGEIDLVKDKKLRDHIFPRGEKSDWTYEPATKNHIRYINDCLTDDEKAIVKAHFLRFVDPINYFLTPNKTHHINGVEVPENKIGEDPALGSYMRNVYKEIFGENNVETFLKEALVCPDNKVANGKKIINITYGVDVKRPNNASSTTKPVKQKKSHSTVKLLSNGSRVKKYSPEQEKIIEDAQNKLPSSRPLKNKAADLFIRVIMYLNDHKLLNANDISMLTGPESKNVFKTGYITLARSIDVVKNKYYKDIIIKINGVDYYPTNDFGRGDSNIECIVKWAAEKGLKL